MQMKFRDIILENPRSSYISLNKFGRFGIAFLIAGLVTGTNWYVQSKLASAKIGRQKQILQRVNSNATVNIQSLKDIANLDNIEGAKVTVTGQLQPGRFIVKRKVDDLEGYYVLAPFVVKQTKRFNINDRTENIKYMLNLGWLPKQSKHLVQEASAANFLSFDQLPEELALDEDAPVRTTITAYVRKGEQRDILRGYNNHPHDRLYKFIDLPLLERVFNSIEPSFRQVYLDRTEDEQKQFELPIPKYSEFYKYQIDQEIEFIKKRASQLTWGVGLVSFLSAALLGAL